MKNKQIIQATIITILTFVIIYLSIAYINNELNASLWNPDIRAIHVGLSSWLSFSISAIYIQFDKDI